MPPSASWKRLLDSYANIFAVTITRALTFNKETKSETTRNWMLPMTWTFESHENEIRMKSREPVIGFCLLPFLQGLLARIWMASRAIRSSTGELSWQQLWTVIWTHTRAIKLDQASKRNAPRVSETMKPYLMNRFVRYHCGRPSSLGKLLEKAKKKMRKLHSGRSDFYML